MATLRGGDYALDMRDDDWGIPVGEDSDIVSQSSTTVVFRTSLGFIGTLRGVFDFSSPQALDASTITSVRLNYGTSTGPLAYELTGIRITVGELDYVAESELF